MLQFRNIFINHPYHVKYFLNKEYEYEMYTHKFCDRENDMFRFFFLKGLYYSSAFFADLSFCNTKDQRLNLELA